MKRFTRYLSIGLALVLAGNAFANEDEEGCKDSPLFTRMPGYHIYQCESSEFDAKQIPVDVDADGEGVFETIEGTYHLVVYYMDDDTTPASPLQILRNHLNAARAAGAEVVREFGAKSYSLGEWPDIQQQVATLKFTRDGKETWVHLGSVNDGEYYAIASVERQAMAQAVSVNELLDQINRDGFLTLSVHFDTAKATLRPESAPALDQAVAMLKAAPEMKIEVAGHTDNVGNAESNMALSQQRAESVRAALVERGIDAGRLTAKGYGQTVPVADNRSEDGRAKNRRVEMVKQK